MLELLAPAGDIRSFDAAINSGADAVYLGLSDFNARKKAENFSVDNLRECVKKAHFFGVKVYITLNTLVRDDEMRTVLSLVRAAVEARADAFIVQDLGVARVLRATFPNIVLHASTQLGVHNLYGAKIAEELGFKRVVLSRETKLEDIRAIREGTELEIEYFVQGALCVAFSGNCYLSAVEQGASGNRGLCKQLCRLPYKAVIDDVRADGFLLSAKDLCLADSVRQLAEAGVTSFKIEGRLRREEYVERTVEVYRRMIDGVGDGAKLTERDRESLKIGYCRGGEYLERAYLDAGTPSVIGKDFNNHTGLQVGVVARVSPFKTDLYRVTVSSNRPLSNGDGLKFFENVLNKSKKNSANIKGQTANVKGQNIGKISCEPSLKETVSLGVGDVSSDGRGSYTFVTKTPVKVGWQVHLISTARERQAERRVGIELSVRAMVGEQLTLVARCQTECGAVEQTAVGDVCVGAKTSPTSVDEIRRQVSKTADSGFEVTDCEVETDGVFIPKSVLNALRRELFERQINALIAAREGRVVSTNGSVDFDTNASLCKQNDNIKAVFVHSDTFDEYKNTGTANDGLVVLCPSEYSAKEINRMVTALSVSLDSVALQLPIIANGKDLKVIERLLGELPQIRTLVSENIYGFELARHGYEVIAGAGHNVLNASARAACKELGAKSVLLSIESGLRKSVTGDELPLMTFAHCPYKTVFKNDCKNCSYRAGLKLVREGREYLVRRERIHGCYFGLY